jgi:hypothetical protein
MDLQFAIESGATNRTDYTTSWKIPNYYRGIAVDASLRQTTYNRDVFRGHNDGTSFFNLQVDSDGTIREQHHNPDGTFNNCNIQGFVKYISTETV